MWIQYFGTLLHFSLSIGMAAVFLACAWLYWDGNRINHSRIMYLRVIGFVVLAISFIFGGVEVQGLGWSATPWAMQWVPSITLYFRIAGYLLVLLSMILEPLQPMPYASAFILGSSAFQSDLRFMVPILAALVGFLYIRRATVGLENHIKRPAFAFWSLALYELLQLNRIWYSTIDIRIWEYVAPFGHLWWIGRGALLVALLILGIWVFGYLLKQFTVQLFIIFAFVFLGTFLLVTAGYTGLLLRELRVEAGTQVKMSLNVLKYALGEQQARLLSESELTASKGEIIEAVSQQQIPELATLMTASIYGKRISQAVVIDKTGKVLWRSDYPDRVGEIWPDQLTVNRIARGETTKSIVGNNSSDLAEIALTAAAPITVAEKVEGGIIMSLVVDPLLLSGIKSATGLEAAVFNQATLVATSVEHTGRNIPIGVEETRIVITDRVLKEGASYQGAIDFLSIPYIAVYEPLTDQDGGVIGMLFGGRPEVEVMATAARSLEYTFYATVILMCLSMFPAWLIARSIARQTR